MDQNVCKRSCLFPADRMQRIHCELEFAVGKFLDQENDGLSLIHIYIHTDLTVKVCPSGSKFGRKPEKCEKMYYD